MTLDTTTHGHTHNHRGEHDRHGRQGGAGARRTRTAATRRVDDANNSSHKLRVGRHTADEVVSARGGELVREGAGGSYRTRIETGGDGRVGGVGLLHGVCRANVPVNVAVDRNRDFVAVGHVQPTQYTGVVETRREFGKSLVRGTIGGRANGTTDTHVRCTAVERVHERKDVRRLVRGLATIRNTERVQRFGDLGNEIAPDLVVDTHSLVDNAHRRGGREGGAVLTATQRATEELNQMQAQEQSVGGAGVEVGGGRSFEKTVEELFLRFCVENTQNDRRTRRSAAECTVDHGRDQLVLTIAERRHTRPHGEQSRLITLTESGLVIGDGRSHRNYSQE